MSVSAARLRGTSRGLINVVRSKATIRYQARDAQHPIQLRVPLGHIKALVRGLQRVLVESCSGAEQVAIFCHRPDAQFAALSRPQQDALLERGYWPR